MATSGFIAAIDNTSTLFKQRTRNIKMRLKINENNNSISLEEYMEHFIHIFNDELYYLIIYYLISLI